MKLTFGLGLEVRLGGLSEEVADAVKEFTASGRFLTPLCHDDLQVIDIIEVIGVSQVGSWEDLFLGWVPLGWEVEAVAVALVWGEAGEVAGLASEDVGGLTVGGEGWLRRANEGQGDGEGAQERPALHERGLLPVLRGRANSHASLRAGGAGGDDNPLVGKLTGLDHAAASVVGGSRGEAMAMAVRRR